MVTFVLLHRFRFGYRLIVRLISLTGLFSNKRVYRLANKFRHCTNQPLHGTRLRLISAKFIISSWHVRLSDSLAIVPCRDRLSAECTVSFCRGESKHSSSSVSELSTGDSRPVYAFLRFKTSYQYGKQSYIV